jgi:non-specific serine/threonine protein kinase/serine/threonine-protein kinase
VNPERWKQVKELFGSALERDPRDRAEYLREACGPDKDLRAELESLLASHDSEQSTVGDTPGGPSPGAAGMPGERIGAYQVIQRIGAGGMGVVYLAVRADEAYNKKVAIKVVQSTVIGAQEVLERFRHERRILATLDHPNIAKLLDGGATSQGLPYFAMDYVEGVRIDEYCVKRELPIAERLRLFRDICSAVQYVHQNLVVHRDLKPGNILVTAEGVPKLLDFGIAKLLGPETVSNLTQADCRPMTPGYASPEQVRGDPVTTASDVYSLGVILYELLTSRSPYRLKNDSQREMLQAVCDQEPEKPSVAVSEKLARQLRGDLDNIALKALHKDPQHRYASAEQLSEDLRRHLEGLPVSARHDTWSYRTAKFIGRHRVGVAAAAMVVVSLAGGLVAATWQARVARRERANAQRQFNDVRKLANSFLFEFHGAIEHLPGSTPARKLLVQKALEYLNKLAQQAGGDRGLQRELTEAYLKVGDVQGNPYGAGVGDTKGAVQSYTQALRVSQTLADSGVDHATKPRLYLRRLYKSRRQVLPILGQPSKGAADLRKSLELLEGLAATDSRNDEVRDELANTYQELGDLEGHSGLQNLGDPQSALEHYHKALAIYQAQVSGNPSSQKGRRGLAVVRVRIADLAMARGDLKGILNEYRDALKTAEELSAADSTNSADLGLLVLGYRKVGAALEELGDSKAALDNYAKAASVNESLIKADPDNVQAGMALAITLRYTGDLLSKTGDPAGALSNYQKVLSILERLSAVQPGNVLVEGRRAEMLIFVAAALARNGRIPDAHRMTSEALAITRTLAAREDATPDDLSDYAASFLTCIPADLREPATAVEYAKRAVEKSGGRDRAALDLLARARREMESQSARSKAAPKRP